MSQDDENPNVSGYSLRNWIRRAALGGEEPPLSVPTIFASDSGVLEGGRFLLPPVAAVASARRQSTEPISRSSSEKKMPKSILSAMLGGDGKERGGGGGITMAQTDDAEHGDRPWNENAKVKDFVPGGKDFRIREFKRLQRQPIVFEPKGMPKEQGLVRSAPTEYPRVPSPPSSVQQPPFQSTFKSFYSRFSSPKSASEQLPHTSRTGLGEHGKQEEEGVRIRQSHDDKEENPLKQKEELKRSGSTHPAKNSATIQRCVSSRELRMMPSTLAPLSGSPYAFMLHQRDVLEATLQRRLMNARNTRQGDSSPSLLIPPSGIMGASSQQTDPDNLRTTTRNKAKTPGENFPVRSVGGSRGAGGSNVTSSGELTNRTRNRRRAEHTRAVVNDLCEIVADLFVAESKLLNPSSYGVVNEYESDQREQILKSVKDFVSALPPRYALNIETPSEVLLHMRLMAAARSDNRRAVVHITNLEEITSRGLRSSTAREDSRWRHEIIRGEQDAASTDSMTPHLVTISCADANGLLEFITRLLGTGGSRVTDADVMMSTDNIVLDRFVVQMNGRLRLDKLSQSIEALLARGDQGRSQETGSETNEAASFSSESGGPLSSQGIMGPTGSTDNMAQQSPLYFQAPPLVKRKQVSIEQLQEEMQSAVPLSAVLAAASMTGLDEQGGATIDSSLSGAEQSASQRNIEITREVAVQQKGEQTFDESSPSSSRVAVPPPRRRSSQSKARRPLVNREATNFNMDGEVSSDEYMTIMAPATETSHGFVEDRVIPLIPFDELMLIETLATGRASTIYRAAWNKKSTGGETRTPLANVEMVALKVAVVDAETQDYSQVDELRREADIAAMLKHPNICDLVGVTADPDCFCLAYEFCEGGSLLSLLTDSRRYYDYLPIALDIANGMAYLHSRNVIHRDLKPSNVLLTRDHRGKISDFGMSVANTGQELTAETGTYRYMAPEVIRHESYSSNADVYSFGIVLWQLITREIPFSDLTPIQTAFAVAQGQRPEVHASTPAPLKEIIMSCWDHDSHKRPSFTYIAMALADFARMAFSPANVGAKTLQIANEMLANVEGNATINVDFSTPVSSEFGRNTWISNLRGESVEGRSNEDNVGLEI